MTTPNVVDVPVDVVVLGMGPGGEDVAGKLAEAGLSVVGMTVDWSAASALTGAVSRRR